MVLYQNSAKVSSALTPLSAPTDGRVGRVIEVDVLRVFTRDGAGGNPLGVVTVGDLSERHMQEIAHELGYSETVFIDPGVVPVPVRIFTPGSELPFAGHPLVGTAWHVGKTTGQEAVTLRCVAGDITSWVEGAATWIETAASHPVTGSTAAVPGAVDVRIANVPMPYVAAQLRDVGSVAAFDPAAAAGSVLYIWAEDHLADPGRRIIRARFFADEFGIAEDPATGSAAAALAAVLRSRGEIEGSLIIHQGEEMGLASEIALRWTEDTTSLGGMVAIHGSTAIELSPSS